LAPTPLPVPTQRNAQLHHHITSQQHNTTRKEKLPHIDKKIPHPVNPPPKKSIHAKRNKNSPKPRRKRLRGGYKPSIRDSNAIAGRLETAGAKGGRRAQARGDPSPINGT